MTHIGVTMFGQTVREQRLFSRCLNGFALVITILNEQNITLFTYHIKEKK